MVRSTHLAPRFPRATILPVFLLLRDPELASGAAIPRASAKPAVVKRVACAQEMGLCVNPEGAWLQLEGGITMGLGYALTEEVRFNGGEILHSNFDTYTIPHFSWLPRIETAILDAKDSPFQGGGEPPIICMGAVIANAISDATGARLLQLPMTPERVKEVHFKLTSS